MNVPVVAIIGRPNVGKSALFNRLIGDHKAIVSEEAGTTRDRHFARADWAGKHFWLVDTGGLTDDPSIPMDVEIRKQVDEAIDEADLLLFIVDAKAGVHPGDLAVVDMLRKAGKPWLVVANKVDDPRSMDWMEFYNLGAGEPLPLSATNGKGTGDFLDVVVANIPAAEAEDDQSIRVAVVGRPNVGKSSLVNRLLGEERLVVSDVAGTTRDAIDTPMRYHGKDLIFVDTAGLRRQSRIEDGIEFYSSLRTRRAIERSDVCVLLIDPNEGLLNQDLKIANLVWDAGRGLVVFVNKWDLYEKDDKSSAKFEKECAEKANFLKFVPFLFGSAKTGQRAQQLLELVIAVNAERTRRIPTSEVNEKLGELLARRQPPQASGREVRLNYATQIEVAPPTIAVFGNHPDLVEEHYIRYLHNGFREFWGFTGSPLLVVMRRKAA